MTHISTLLPLPKSLNIPEHIASATKLTPSSLCKIGIPSIEIKACAIDFFKATNRKDKLTVSPSLYFDSKTDIAANEPDPIVANGSVSVEPCGYICDQFNQ